MPRFSVEFGLTGNVMVNCDDEEDAKEFIGNISAEQVLRWGVQRTSALIDREVRVLRVTPCRGA